MTSIRNETPEDYDAVRELTFAAFTHCQFGYNGEAELIDALRAASTDHLSLVACSDNKVVGHVLFTPVVIRTSLHDISGMGLAPMSVEPTRQRTGVGSSLVIAGLERLMAGHCPFVVVLGHPEYYARFGFRPASQLDVSHGFQGIPQDVFFIRCNPDFTLRQIVGGRAYYLPEFGPQHDGT